MLIWFSPALSTVSTLSTLSTGCIRMLWTVWTLWHPVDSVDTEDSVAHWGCSALTINSCGVLWARFWPTLFFFEFCCFFVSHWVNAKLLLFDMFWYPPERCTMFTAQVVLQLGQCGEWCL